MEYPKQTPLLAGFFCVLNCGAGRFWTRVIRLLVVSPAGNRKSLLKTLGFFGYLGLGVRALTSDRPRHDGDEAA